MYRAKMGKIGDFSTYDCSPMNLSIDIDSHRRLSISRQKLPRQLINVAFYSFYFHLLNPHPLYPFSLPSFCMSSFAISVQISHYIAPICSHLSFIYITLVHFCFYTVKKRFPSFPSSAGMSLPNSPWAGIMTS